MMAKLAGSLGMAALTTAMLASCSANGNPYALSEALLEPQPAPEPVYEEPDLRSVQQEPEPLSSWECFLDPTMNYDWHDDVLCTNGVSFERPYLLEWMDFVTESDLISEAQNYEKFLNGQ